MKNKKWITTGLTIMFIVLAGILYSCRSAGIQEAQVVLQNQDTNFAQTNVQEKDENTKVIQDDTKAIQDDTKVIQENEIVPQEDTEVIRVELIYIHICGAVKEPNVYEVEKDSRLFDIIKLAGGLTDDAAGDFVNQAALVEDGQQIYIPTKEEVEDMTPSDFSVKDSDIEKPVKVNINAANMEELMTLTGIGESKAKSIITYRQDNDGFKTIEEIKNIDGIKDSVFNKICDMLTVN